MRGRYKRKQLLRILAEGLNPNDRATTLAAINRLPVSDVARKLKIMTQCVTTEEKNHEES